MAYREEFEQGAKERPETAREGQPVQAPQPETAAPVAEPPKAKKKGFGKKPIILAVLAAALGLRRVRGLPLVDRRALHGFDR